MGKRELKKQYPDLDCNFIDLVSMLDTTKNNKLTPFLIKQFYKWVQFTGNEKQDTAKEYYKMCEVLGTPKNELDEILKRMVFKWAQPKLESIEEFTEHMNANRLIDNDINNYDTWESLRTAVSEAEQKHGIKTKKNRIQILHQDSEWFVMKPLSIEASANYGMGTKWCTSSLNGDFFHRYSREGVLIYVINRKNSVKYAFYSSPKEFSVWTETDARVDSMETIIPFELLVDIRKWCDYVTVGPNYNYFEDEDKKEKKTRRRGGGQLLNITGDNPVANVVEAEVTTEAQPRENIATLINSIAESVAVTEDEDLTVGDIPSDESLNEPDRAVLQGGNTFTVTTNLGVEDVEADIVWGEEEDLEDAEESMDMESNRITIDITPEEEQLVGLGDDIHGRETPHGERTWENPYPNGPGGGFMNEEAVLDEMPEEMMNTVIPTNEETRAAFVGVVGGVDVSMEVEGDTWDEESDVAG